MAPPPGAGSARVRRDSALSDDENVFDDEKPLSPKSPPSKKEESGNFVPAPPPKVCAYQDLNLLLYQMNYTIIKRNSTGECMGQKKRTDAYRKGTG